LRVDEQDARNRGDHRYRDESRRVVRELLVKARVDHQRGGRRGEQRVAVGLGAPHGLGADRAARTDAVLDDDRVSPSAASRSPTMRGSASAAPPAGNGTMMWIARPG